jgi:hypothetical protein
VQQQIGVALKRLRDGKVAIPSVEKIDRTRESVALMHLERIDRSVHRLAAML